MLNAAATSPAPGTIPAGARGVRVKGLTLEDFARRTDALALRVGTRTTASVLLLACVIVILIGAQSMLQTLESMDRDIKVMNEQMAIAGQGVVILNDIMDSLEPTSRHMGAVVKTVEKTRDEVKTSSAAIADMSDTTARLHTDVAGIAESTRAMSGSLQSASDGTGTLATTITDLNTRIEPLVSTQHKMLVSTRTMRSGVDGMNASLAYTIRIMNWITAPRTGSGMTIRAELPKQTLPPLPGIRAEVKPVPVFPRNIWPIYTGP